MVLTVEHLECSNGSFRLRNVSFAVRGGTITGLVGPNGAGKTTLLTCIAGLRRVDSGQIAAARGGVAFVAEEPALFRGVTVAEHLRFVELACRLPGHVRRDELVEQFALGPHLGKAPKALSLGTRRKTALAMGLLRDSSVLVLDEPLNGLDPDAQRELRSAMAGVAAEDRSVLVSSHWLPELERVATDYLVLDGGELRATGTLDELREGTGAGADASLEEVYFAVLGRSVDPT